MTDEQYAKERWVSRYSAIQRQIRHLQQECRQIEDMATSVSPNLSGMPGGSGTPSDRVGKAAARKADLEMQYMDEIEEWQSIEDQIRRAIFRVDDPVYQDLLSRRYLSCESWNAISMNMRIGRSWLFELHAKALDELPLRVDSDSDGKLKAYYVQEES